jgi:hypothetical protein
MEEPRLIEEKVREFSADFVAAFFRRNGHRADIGCEASQLRVDFNEGIHAISRKTICLLQAIDLFCTDIQYE